MFETHEGFFPVGRSFSFFDLNNQAAYGSRAAFFVRVSNWDSVVVLRGAPSCASSPCVSKVGESCVGTAMDGLTARRATGTIRTTGATAEEGGEVGNSKRILGV